MRNFQQWTGSKNPVGRSGCAEHGQLGGRSHYHRDTKDNSPTSMDFNGYPASSSAGDHWAMDVWHRVLILLNFQLNKFFSKRVHVKRTM